MEISGGDRLDKVLTELGKKVASATQVDVGFLEDKTYPDGTPVAMVAAIQEFGAPKAGIPPRPFFRNMVKKDSGGWGKDLADLLEQHDYDAKKVLALMGVKIVAQLEQSIIDTNDPPLSPVTLMLRKMKKDNPDLVITGATVGEAARLVSAGESYAGVSTKPLVDTGVLLSSAAYRVK